MRSRWSPFTPVVPMLVLALAGCRSGRAPARLGSAPPASARSALLEAAEAFYGATTSEDLRRAVERAQAVDPGSAIYHELAAELVRLERDDQGAMLDHWLAALSDPAHETPHLDVQRAFALAETPQERTRLKAVLESLAAHHPRPAVQALARRRLASLLWLEGRFEAARSVEAKVRNGFDWRILGAFDNDQGKGFDEVFPPERTIDLTQRYEGTLVEIGWRRPIEDPSGPALDLGATITPSRWAIAYATTAFSAETAGAYEVRVTTSAPLKVWLDGQLVLSARTVTFESFDQFVLPLRLEGGRHRLLVKSAQDHGRWQLGVRVTASEGAPSDAIRPLPAKSAPTGGGAASPATPEDLFEAFRAQLDGGGPLRTRALLIRQAHRMGVRSKLLAASEALHRAAPEGIWAGYERAAATWNHGERGKTSDLLEALAQSHGDELPFLRLQHARFLRQEGLQRKARAALRAAEASLGFKEMAHRWARQFDKQGWPEDRCHALEKALELRPQSLEHTLELADCYRDLDFDRDAQALYESVLRDLPAHTGSLRAVLGYARQLQRFDRAEALVKRLIEAAPHRAYPQLELAELHRRQRAFGRAEEALERARALAPDRALPWERLGHVRYQAGDTKGAVTAWQEALTRNPDDDQVAHRLAWLAPEDEGIWAADVPDEERIEAALAQRSVVQPAPGAHVLNLLDHEVTLIKPDGSTTNVVTLVMKALDDSGRDRLTKVNLRRGGRLRLRKAFVVAPDGRRTQVSNVRSRVARFRNLSVGGTVVLQYRHDAKPVGYLARHVARNWWFQASAAQAVESEWVLWMPKGTALHEWMNDPDGRIQRSQKDEGDHVRVAWRAESVEPLVGEPNMPTAREVALNMLVSTVPDWDTFLEWERALLTDAFRDDAAIAELARRIVGQAAEPRAKALRIHRWLMEEIRYQQDYENDIAGVRPHPAPVVVERSYGDCKDKSVLFITLAQQVGLEAHFALLRTRPQGPLLRSVPMQQFDHAIVYVPEQPGLTKGFFVDSTADALDLGALRQDDAGVPALVLNPKTHKHTWRQIPFRPASENGQRVRTQLQLTEQGSALGELHFEAWGTGGSSLRRLARNARALEQGLQALTARLYRGGVARAVEAVETKDLEAPAHLRLELEVPTFARREGRELRARLPPVWNPKGLFQLKDRDHPLVLGVPRSFSWKTSASLASTLQVKRLPSNLVVEAPCFRFERLSNARGAALEVVQRFTTSCERIEVAAYAEHREKAEVMMQALEEELVLTRRAARATR